jgi:thiamine biosynthesis lipoprotein
LAEHAIRGAIRSIFHVHESMTLHGPSPLTRLNSLGWERPVQVPGSLIQVLGHSREVSARTGGLFDATSPLSRGEGESARSRWGGIEVDPEGQQVRYTRAGLGLDFNGIAKGYAVDCAAAALRQRGMRNFLVNAGGDLYASGERFRGEGGWPVELMTGYDEERISTFWVSDRAIATSGNAFQSPGEDGQRRSHLVHPLRGGGLPEILSATVIADTAIDADAWATAAFVGERGELEALVGAEPRVEAYRVLLDGGLDQVGA